jgi:hypothetical protein
VYRERLAARGERVESVAAIHERLAIQREVVDAVLSLGEPYRSTILLHYYDGSSSAQIAKIRGAPTGTVRSQLSRGLQILRTKLDAKFGGDRGGVGSRIDVIPTARVEGCIRDFAFKDFCPRRSHAPHCFGIADRMVCLAGPHIDQRA